MSTSRLWRWLHVFLLCGAGVSAWAQTPSRLLQSAYWLDASGQASWAEARQAPFNDYQGVLQKGYTADTVWLRLRIAAAPDQASLVLIVGPSFLRRIELYDPMQMTHLQEPPRLSGRVVLPDGNAYQGVDNGFIILASPHDRDVYLRIQTTTSVVVDCNVLDPHSAEKNNQRLVTLLAFQLGFLLLTVLWGLINWVVQQDRLYGFFSWRQLHGLLYIFCFTGLLKYWTSDLLSMRTQEQIYNVALVTFVTSFSWFDTRLLAHFGARKQLLQLASAIAWCSLISLALLSLGMVRQGLSTMAMVILLYTVVLTLAAFTTPSTPDAFLSRTAVWSIKIGHTVFFLLILMPVLSFLGIFQVHWLTTHLMLVPSTLYSILLLALLAIRSRQNELRLRDAEMMAALSKARLADEIKRRQEKEGFLSMLTHELRNPLTVIRTRIDTRSSDGQAIQKATLAMAKVLERVQQSERDPQSLDTPPREEVDLEALCGSVRADSPHPERIQCEPLPPSLPRLQTDRELLVALLGNLIDNALKYSPAGAVVKMSVQPDTRAGQAGLRFEVCNPVGRAGRPDPTLVFTKYYRAPGAHREIGSGLGLFLVATWAQQLSGVVSCQPPSQDSDPVVFTVWLPI